MLLPKFYINISHNHENAYLQNSFNHAYNAQLLQHGICPGRFC